MQRTGSISYASNDVFGHGLKTDEKPGKNAVLGNTAGRRAATIGKICKAVCKSRPKPTGVEFCSYVPVNFLQANPPLLAAEHNHGSQNESQYHRPVPAGFH